MAKAHLAAVVLCTLLAAPGWAITPSPALVATPPQPQWSELTVQQKIVLAPLSDDWDSLEYFRQKKWLGIAARFPTMSSQEQRRIQAQMQEWGKLTQEQRELARENFKAASQLPIEKKQVLKKQWEEYSSLPAEEREKLKQQATSRPTPKPGRTPVAVPAMPVATPGVPVTQTNPDPPPSDAATKP